jgi:membrane protein required for colicin V production
MPIALLDLIVLGIVLISALLAMVRGFTREVLSIASWAAAAAATLYFLPDVRDWARATLNLKPEILADVIAGAGIFLITLLLVSLVTMRLSDFILDSRVGPFDRALGFLYGGARGLLLAVVAFLFFNWLVPERSQPSWVVDSASKPLLESTGESLLAMLPEDPEATILKQLKGIPGTGTEPAPEPTPETGYRPAEQQQMDRLTAPTTPN